MVEERINPTLQFCVLCDAVTQGEDGKPTFVGVFEIIRFPSILPQFTVVIRWCNGMGKFKTQFRLLNPDLTELITTIETEFELGNRVNTATGVYAFANVEFKVAGVYWIEIRLEGDVVSAIPLPVYS